MATTKVIFSGFGGQGVLTLGQFVAFSALDKGEQVTWMPSYGAEMRGGTANCSVVVSDKQIGSPVVGMADILVAMNKPTILKYESKVRPGGTIIINSSIVDPAIITRKDVEIVEVKASDIASEIGSTKVANMVMCGTLMKVAPHLISVENAKKTIADKFGGKKAKFIPLNEEAIRRGME